jgi:hypothetical protein
MVQAPNGTIVCKKGNRPIEQRLQLSELEA